MKADQTTAWYLVFGAWLIAGVSTLGALFFGEVMQVPTCALCWYQRIFMFPLALVLPLGLFPFDPKVVRYALPLAAIGGLIAVYHVLVVAGVIPEALQPCTLGVPCKEQVIVWIGFVTIPLLAAAAFAAIVVLLCLARFRSLK
ncbi:MAG: disulfide bond formation protein B [Betaproteobacteria bacterium]|nr:MAG: disulfide bond formation protein B [Betaproteobacteria bacterium]